MRVLVVGYLVDKVPHSHYGFLARTALKLSQLPLPVRTPYLWYMDLYISPTPSMVPVAEIRIGCQFVLISIEGVLERLGKVLDVDEKLPRLRFKG